jgi:uncharacterized protein YndB with AHSA1/START domain
MGMREVRHVSVAISRPPADVYAFVSAVENLPRWAAGLCETVRKGEDGWVGEGPLGEVKLRFTEPNDLGVLDHDVEVATGITLHNPIRVVPNGSGSELTFTVFRRPELSPQEFAEDAGAVERDLRKLKTLLEHAHSAAR